MPFSRLARTLAPALAIAALSPARPIIAQGPTILPAAAMAPAARVDVPAAGASVPLRVAPQPMVEVSVNGSGPLRFLVATVGPTELTPAAAAKLGLRVERPARTLGTVRLDSLRIGDAVARGVVAVVPDSLPGPIDGIIGAVTLANVLVTIDFPGSQLRIERGALPAPNGRDVAALSPAGRFWDVVDVLGAEVTVGGRKTVAVLNVLSPSTFAASPSVASGIALAGEPVVAGRMVSAYTGMVDLRMARLAGDASVGGTTFERPMLTIVPVPDQLPNALSLGSGTLRQFAVTLDLANRRARFSRASASPVPAPPPMRTFGFEMRRGDGRLLVSGVTGGGAAERAGVRVGDEIVEVDGRATSAAPVAWGSLLERAAPVPFRFARGAETIQASLAPITLVP